MSTQFFKQRKTAGVANNGRDGLRLRQGFGGQLCPVPFMNDLFGGDAGLRRRQGPISERTVSIGRLPKGAIALRASFLRAAGSQIRPYLSASRITRN